MTSAGTFLHVRSVEIASVKPIGVSAITVTVTGTPVAMNNKTRNIIQPLSRFLYPDEDSVFALFVALFGRVLEDADTDLLDVMHAHWVDKANNEARKASMPLRKATWTRYYAVPGKPGGHIAAQASEPPTGKRRAAGRCALPGAHQRTDQGPDARRFDA